MAMEVKGKGKAIPVTDRGGPFGCETLRFPHFVDIRLTDGGKVVSPMHQLPFTPQEGRWKYKIKINTKAICCAKVS
jgi:hypothetical protein